MVSMQQRMRKLQTKLLAIRLGSGAFILPKDIKRIHMRFAQKLDGGHMGARKFWRHELVRLKYHNPAIPMTIDRTATSTDPALLSIHFTHASAIQTSDSATSSPAPTHSTTSSTSASVHTPTDRVETINITHTTNSEILDAVVRLTKAYPVEPTAEEREELRLLQEQEERSIISRERTLAVRTAQKREQELLEQARGYIADQTA